MSMLSPITRISGTLALALMVVGPGLASSAHADAYGTQEHDLVIRQSAASTPSAPLSADQTETLSRGFKLGEHLDAIQPRSAGMDPSRSASTVPMAVDVVGQGGPQDELARQIHTPGSATGW
jgi:hypothetical protein